MSNEEQQVTKIKETAIISLIDALAAYKEKGIGAIAIIDASYYNEVRTFGFNTIKKVKQHS